MEHSSDVNLPPWRLDHQQTETLRHVAFCRAVPWCPKNGFWLNFVGKQWAGNWCPRQMKNIGFECCPFQTFILFTLKNWSPQKSQLPKMGIMCCTKWAALKIHHFRKQDEQITNHIRNLICSYSCFLKGCLSEQSLRIFPTISFFYVYETSKSNV